MEFSLNLLSLLALASTLSAHPYNPQNFPPTYSPSSLISPSDTLAIRNLLSTYAIAVDAKNTTLLTSVFAADATASFTNPNQTVAGASAIAAHDLYAFTGLNTQHALSTQTLAGGGANGTVAAVTYFTAAIFGKDCYLGQTVHASGSYEDVLGKVEGKWVIKDRKQVYANPEDPFIGAVGIVGGPACNETKTGSSS